jgi:predicted P-loop ATPase
MAALKYDGKIVIAVGKSRKSVNWQNKEIKWAELVNRLATPTRTPETYSEYKASSKAGRDKIKDVGGFVGGALKGNRRKTESVLKRMLLTLDIDAIPEGEDVWPTVETVLCNAAVLHSTHSHTNNAPRLRLVMPLSRAATPDEYTALARRIAGDIGVDMCDDTTYESARMMYWPSVSLDADYRYEVADAPWLDVDEQLARYSDWRNTDEWPVSSRKSAIIQRLMKKQGDPLEKSGVVGAFCRVYSIEDAIEQFLPEVYEPCGMPDRYSYIPADSSAGLVVYNNGKFAYSHHATDPAGGTLCNAFDLVRLHLYGDKDDATVPGTPTCKYPSYSAMLDMVKEDKAVCKEAALRRIQEVQATFGDDEDTDWLEQLTVNSKGKIEATIDNAYIILLHDPSLRGNYYYDEFRERPAVCGDLPWIKAESRTADGWSDADDSGLRAYIEKTYDISNIAKIRDAVEIAMLQIRRHPVREYLNGLIWDGVKRAETLFIDYLGADDDAYTRAVTRKALIGATARIMLPGCKHDHTLVLVGPQGCRKSSTLAKIGKSWFSDSLYTITGKDAYELLQGHWIIEMGEMAATKKSELEQIKMFISKQSDSYRAAYAHRTQEHPRQCAFFGSTNDDEFLRDPTGGRRFWPVKVTDKGRILADGLTDEIVDQIWAEAVIYYGFGENWYLDEYTEALARDVQARHTEMNSKQGLIENYLNTLLPDDWETRDLENRLLYLHGGFDIEEKGTTLRDRVCALEIWQELFKGDPKNFNYAQSREITGILRQIPGWESKSCYACGRLYGRQRAFVRKGDL